VAIIHNMHIRSANFRELAGQVHFRADDLTLVEGEAALWRLPIPLFPPKALELIKLFYAEKSDEMKRLASNKGLHIERKPYLGPQILWLKAGRLYTREDRIAAFIIIPKPHEPPDAAAQSDTKELLELETEERHTDITVEGPQEELGPKVLIKSPIDGPLFADSLIEFEVGDIIILESKEELHVRTDVKVGDMSICMLSVLHRTECIRDGKDVSQMVAQ